ncbi:peptide chain release factor 1-like, mitochondrial [Sipha flava]|uniref:Peptide chain release factor 1-like, mitochondrial n=1 Tax=Sipha flava TaxID=143950 RepID=A0A8B8FAI5_9HEMI|nr:peptide chain release factor 1-like, mitochondrial [Sipha flava]XP_025407627.1 peptide chain release factor 1-like, mitochondrial [Sipha flava]
MKFLNYKNILLMYNKTLWSNKCFYSSFSKHQYLLSRYYSSMPEHRICSALLNNSGVRSYLDSLISKDYSDIMSKSNVSALILAIRSIRVDLQSLKEFDTEKEKDEEFILQLQKEKESYEKQLNKLELELLNSLVPNINVDCGDIMLEITAGVGGQEAMIFTQELFEMYNSFVNYRGWQSEVADYSPTDMGGIRHACIMISGNDCYRSLQHEGGVHRVQRVPKTEKSGRVHTSTVTVAVLPQPAELDVVINDRDLVIETKRASGAGGQHVNKTDSAVRMHHKPTGIVVECQTDRSQIKNRKIALQKLRAIIYQKQLDQQQLLTRSVRKQQVGSSGRSEKIRTYNFNQDRITDHRLSKNFHNLMGFLEGRDYLDKIINELQERTDEILFREFVESISQKN